MVGLDSQVSSCHEQVSWRHELSQVSFGGVSRTGSPQAAEKDVGLMDALVQLSFAVQGVLGAVSARHDLSTTQVRLLGILRDREPAMGDLREHLGLEKSSVTGLIDRAERRGLASRTSGRPDGRAVHVRLTTAGAELANRLASEIYADLARMLETLPAAGRRRLADLAESVLAADPAGRPAAGQAPSSATSATGSSPSPIPPVSRSWPGAVP
jgi:MarR family transcriptional regulator, lower aerobic nicotinate degradation pathway regulator